MEQRKLGSFVESLANIVIGFTINYVANITVLPALGVGISHKQALLVGVVFTVISVIRSYYVRRMFNKIKTSWNVHNPAKQFDVHP